MIDTSLERHWFMHTPHAAIGLAAGGKCGIGELPLPTTAAPPPKETRTLQVGLIAGPEATWDLAAVQLAVHLRRDPDIEVYYAWDCVELGIEDAADYDCLVLLGWPPASSRQQIKRIELYCRGGGSLVALRSTHAEIPAWPDFAEEVLGGRQPVGRRCRLLEVERSEAAWNHPVVEGMETMIAEGEVYNGPHLAPATTVLLTARNGQRAQPVAWARRHEGGRVFCSTLGLSDDFREPCFLRLVANAVRWAGSAGGK